MSIEIRRAVRMLPMALTAAAFLLIADVPARAQGDAAPPKYDAETMQAVLQRLAELEAEVKTLKAEKAAAVAPPSGAATVGNGAAGSASTPTPGPAPVPQETQSADIAELRESQDIRIHGFGAAGWTASDKPGTHGTTFLGDLDLLLTSKISSNASALAEVLFQPRQANSFNVDVGRILLQLAPKDSFKIGIGRYNTSIGFYNSYFNQGDYTQTAVDRPLLFEFASKGGVLPTKLVGATVTGEIPSGAAGLHYLFETGREDFQRVGVNGVTTDLKNGNAINVGLSLRPEGWHGFRTGFSFLQDTIHPFSARVDEKISGAYIVWVSPNFEFLNEGAYIRHAIPGTPETILHVTGFYTQVSRRFGDIRPYFRYEYLNAPDIDKVLLDLRRQSGPTFGLRYDFHTNAALKVQYGRIGRRAATSVNVLTTQVAFTF